MNNPRTVAFFDFDGTLSRIRSGWQTVMADHMLEVLLGTAVATAAHRAFWVSGCLVRLENRIHYPPATFTGLVLVSAYFEPNHRYPVGGTVLILLEQLAPLRAVG